MRLPHLRLRHFLPIAVLTTGVFGLYYVYWGVVALRRGNPTYAAFYGLYGIMGVVLALSLWRVWRGMPRSES